MIPVENLGKGETLDDFIEAGWSYGEVHLLYTRSYGLKDRWPEAEDKATAMLEELWQLQQGDVVTGTDTVYTWSGGRLGSQGSGAATDAATTGATHWLGPALISLGVGAIVIVAGVLLFKFRSQAPANP